MIRVARTLAVVREVADRQRVPFAGGLNLPYFTLRRDIGPAVLGYLEVIQVKCVLRLKVASDDAFAAVGAALLYRAELVRVSHSGGIQIDRDIRMEELGPSAEPL